MKKTMTTMVAIGMVAIPAGATSAEADSNLSEGCALLNQPEFDAELEPVTYQVYHGRGGWSTTRAVLPPYQSIDQGVRDVEFFAGETVTVVFESDSFFGGSHWYYYGGSFNFGVSTDSLGVHSWNSGYYSHHDSLDVQDGAITVELPLSSTDRSVAWYFDDEEEAVLVSAYVSCAGAPGVDTDRDGVIDDLDTDDDNDGVLDPDDVFPLDGSEWADFDGDGIGDNADTDDDDDGVLDPDDVFPLDGSEWADFDGDGVGDNADAATDTAATSAGVIADLVELNGTFGNKHVAKAIDELTASLTLGSVDASTDRKVGKKVFHAYKKAVHELESAIRDATKDDDAVSAAALQTSIDTIVEGSRRLADEANSAGAVSKDVDKASAALAKNDPSKAVDSSAKIWRTATKN